MIRGCVKKSTAVARIDDGSRMGGRSPFIRYPCLEPSRRSFVVVAVLSLLLGSARSSASGQTREFTFESGLEGWVGDFGNYPAADSLFYELAWGPTALPWPLSPADSAFRISGNNHSDDLFMFLKRRITGLLPHQTYVVTISADIASRYPTHASGVGGAPGEGVTIKAGATAREPRGLPAAHRLGQNYPNPFNPVTMIPIELTSDEHVDLRIYDISGRLVAVLVDEVKSAGTTLVPFNAAGRASGSYICCMRAGNTVVARRMTMIR